MVIRIVQMTFEPSKVDDFLQLFESHKQLIKASEGCSHLELLRDTNQPNRFFTYSHWTGEDALEAYRRSELFSSVWSSTKVMFCEKPEAWSLQHETSA